MKRLAKLVQITLFFTAVFTLLPVVCSAASKGPDEPVSLEGLEPGQADTVLAKLSDEQVRSLLVAELAKDFNKNGETANASGDIVNKAAGWLDLLAPANEETIDDGLSTLAIIGQVPRDYIAAARKVGNGTLGGFVIVAVLSIGNLGVAFLVESLVRRFTADFSNQFKEKGIPELNGSMRFLAGILRSVPNFIHILVFTVSAVLLYFLVPVFDPDGARYFFTALLLAVIFSRVLFQLIRLLYAPQLSTLRLIKLDDEAAGSVSRGILLLGTYVFSSILFLAMFKKLNLGAITFSLTVSFLATVLIALLVSNLFRIREYVKERILEQSERNKTSNWVMEQFARFWHIPAITYLIIIWLGLLYDEFSVVQLDNSAFLLSLIAPILFLIFNAAGQWVIRGAIQTLGIANPKSINPEDEDYEEQLIRARENERKLRVGTGRLLRLVILAALTLWVISKWGFQVPFAASLLDAVFESLVTITLGLIAWSFTSSYIAIKLAEVEPEEEEEEGDDEFGGAAPRGRSYTLLPLVRKFIAVTLLVMVTLIVLSSLGINIGPLLAGAGVIGIAVGFGSQKLVSDVMSGFFHLVDDSFRVGEYIQAGSVAGSVEAITLRNVMLRHHRGMLQIVPHSNLGSITNFMRGGIVVKFNLEFPSTTDIEKVRKIIKKVGIAMLEDEEFGKDFIAPVKSQGVREITGATMVIRVKFTAQPGTHFVIRREAFRRITEALAAKGIHYVTPKVIVETPPDGRQDLPTEQVLKGGAAAELVRRKKEKTTTVE